MANLDKRGSYMPRAARQKRAERLVAAAGVTGTVGVLGAGLALIGVIGWGLPIIALIIAAVCIVLFRSVTGQR
jgi:hypothetical protein